MSLGQLASHIVELHNWIKNALSEDIFDFHRMYTSFSAKSIQELLDVLNTRYSSNVETIESMREEKWKSIWKLKAGDYVIAELPKFATFRFIVVNHLISLSGQLTLYMRMLDITLPGIYGLSADEQLG